MHLLYYQSARDGDGVYPFAVRILHLECLHAVLPKDGETLGAIFSWVGQFVGSRKYLVAGDNNSSLTFNNRNVRDKEATSLCVCTYSLDPIIDGSGLGRVIEQSHDCSRFGRLFRIISIAEEAEIKGAMTKANLVVEKVFINVQCKSKEGEQTSPQGNRGMAVAETPNQTGKQ